MYMEVSYIPSVSKWVYNRYIHIFLIKNNIEEKRFEICAKDLLKSLERIIFFFFTSNGTGHS